MTSFSYVATALVLAAVLPTTLHGFQQSSFQRTTLQKSTTSSSQLFSSPVAEESITTAASSSSSSAQQQQPQQQQPPDMQAYSNGYKTVFTEISCELSSPTHGTLPSDLRGTYYKCGPAMFSAGSLLPPKNSLVKPKQPPVPDGVDSNRMVLHPFDGDGGILAITFHGDNNDSKDDNDNDDNNNNEQIPIDTKGKMTTRYRYIRTNAFTAERKKGKKLYTGMESTRSGTSNSNKIGNDLSSPFYRHHLLTGLNKVRKNTSNTRAVYFGKKLVTMWSGGLPYKLDSLGLSTDGRTQLGGVIKKEESSIGAKATIDSSKNRILFYGIDELSESQKESQLNIYEFNSKFQPIKDNDGVVKVKLPGLALIYDFSVTTNYAIFVQPMVKVNGMQYMLSKEPGKSVTLEDVPSLVHIVGRAGSTENNAGSMKTISIPFDGSPDGANLQMINAYEDENDGTIIFDAIRSSNDVDAEESSSSSISNTQWPWATTLSNFQSMSSKKSLWRYKVHPQKGFISKECMSNDQLYFGIVNSNISAQKHRYIYSAIGSMGNDIAPPQGIAKFDLDNNTQESWFPEPYEFCGEPMYAPRQQGDTTDSSASSSEEEEEEDGGYILSTLFNGRDETSELIVFKANNIKSGPIARVPIGIAIPHGNHGCFTPTNDAQWTYEEIERRAKLADKMETRGSMWNEVKSDFSGLGLRFDDMEEYFGDLM